MAKKITYLLGAGASANTIPVVLFMQQRILEIVEFFKSCLPTPSIFIEPLDVQEDKVEILAKIIGDLEWLIQEAGGYYTVDTLAKKYYLTNDNKSLQRLKKSLITYFTIEQQLNIESKKNEETGYYFKKDNIDKRYSSFIAAISKKRYPAAIDGVISDGLEAKNLSFVLNGNIKILSWNYDVQFELSLSFFTNTIIEHVKTNFKILPNNSTKTEVNKIHIESNCFGMVKLNGDAILHKVFQEEYNKYTIVTAKKHGDEHKIFNDFLSEFETSNLHSENDLPNRRNPSPIMSFNFAWENDANYNDKYIGHSLNFEAAEKIASDTEILVVIGYSFPIFNREIDNNLISKMDKLEKVYIQDKNPEKIKSTMDNAFFRFQPNLVKTIEKDGVPEFVIHQKNNRKIEFFEETNTNQFVIPYELNLE